MNDQDPPMWVPMKVKEDAKMTKGYLICKSVFESLEDTMVESKDQPFLMSDAPQTKVKMFKCPLTGDMVEKQKVRKVYFC